jgi:hypothetical protein
VRAIAGLFEESLFPSFEILGMMYIGGSSDTGVTRREEWDVRQLNGEMVGSSGPIYGEDQTERFAFIIAKEY